MSSPPAVGSTNHLNVCIVADELSKMLEETQPQKRQPRGEDREEAKVSRIP